MIVSAKSRTGGNFSVKQLEREKKSVEAKLKKLNDQSRKDDVLTFEELGVDRLFVDEAHYCSRIWLHLHQDAQCGRHQPDGGAEKSLTSI